MTNLKLIKEYKINTEIVMNIVKTVIACGNSPKHAVHVWDVMICLAIYALNIFTFQKIIVQKSTVWLSVLLY